MRKRDPLAREKAHAAEIVKIGIPVLIEAISVSLLIACGAVWIIIAATPIPA